MYISVQEEVTEEEPEINGRTITVVGRKIYRQKTPHLNKQASALF